MNLNSYAAKHLGDSKAQADFARRVGISPGYFKHILKGRRKASDTLAINIERETGGVVRCEEMCPETDWQYIRNSKPEKSA